MTKIKVTTFNIRVNVDGGANHFDKRKLRIFDFVKAETPDIIGFQEVSDYMRDCLRDGLEGYTLVGCGREKNYHGESVTVAYKTDKFELLELKNFWLSPTPSAAGSRYEGDQSNCPRITTAALLKANDGGEPFWFVNTHLDHEGKEARIFGALQILNFAADSEYRCIVTGDFNACPDERAMKIFTENSLCKLLDCTANIKGSFHGFKEATEEEMQKIDYVLTNFYFEEADAVLCEDKPIDGTFMSDHCPISVWINID